MMMRYQSRWARERKNPNHSFRFKDDPTTPKPITPRRRRARKLSDETVEAILLDTSMYSVIAKRHNVSTRMISGIRLGDIYQDVRPDLPRGKAPSRQKLKLTQSEVVRILTTKIKGIKLAEQFEVSPALISLVRHGLSYQDVRPDLPRRS